MSAKVEFKLLLNRIEKFLFQKKENYNKLNKAYRKEIENIRKSIEDMKEKNCLSMEDREKIKIIEIIENYKKEVEEINEIEEVQKYEELIKKLKISNNYSEIGEIYLEAEEIYQTYMETKENRSLQEATREYVILKLKEMGIDNIVVNDEGQIISKSSNGENIVVKIGEKNIQLDIQSSGRKCVKKINQFEKLTKNTLEKGEFSWHSEEEEKEIKQKIEKSKFRFKQKNIYDFSLVKKNK